MVPFIPPALACEQALLGAVTAGQEKEGELATASPEFQFHLQFPRGSSFSGLSDFRQSAESGNERDCKQTLKNTCRGVMRSLLMSPTPISISLRLF